MRFRVGSTIRPRLLALLGVLIAANLGNYQEQSGPACTCSGYQGRMFLSEYLYISERESAAIEAFFPSPADWTFGELPSSDVIDSVEIQGSSVGATNVSIGLTAVFQFSGSAIESDLPGNFSNFDHTALRPHVRTQLEVIATPVGPEDTPERRSATILGRVPFLDVRNPRVRLTRRGMDRFILTARVDSADAHPSWQFLFDVSEAPGLSSVVPLDISNRKAVVEFVLADDLDWENGSDQNDPICLLREPFLVIAREPNDRGLAETLRTWIIGIRDAATGECPQPRDYRS